MDVMLTVKTGLKDFYLLYKKNMIIVKTVLALLQQIFKQAAFLLKKYLIK
jgi:hypothetical protein